MAQQDSLFSGIDQLPFRDQSLGGMSSQEVATVHTNEISIHLSRKEKRRGL